MQWSPSLLLSRGFGRSPEPHMPSDDAAPLAPVVEEGMKPDESSPLVAVAMAMMAAVRRLMACLRRCPSGEVPDVAPPAPSNEEDTDSDEPELVLAAVESEVVPPEPASEEGMESEEAAA